MEVIGYFVDKDGDKTVASDVFVCIAIRDDGKFEYYCPIGQHGEGDIGYINECKEITREQYMNASKGIYTPSDYLEEVNSKRLSIDMWRNVFRNLQDMDEEDYYDGYVDWVEVMWLDGTDEWGLCYGEELFEDGFKTEQEAYERLKTLENLLL